jgi:hypothetical protein
MIELTLKKKMKRRENAQLEELARDCLAEVLMFFSTPHEWLALQLTCKQLLFDMRFSETEWGTANMQFRFTRSAIALHKNDLLNSHIQNVWLVNNSTDPFRDDALLHVLQLGHVAKLKIGALYCDELH